jgi:hypothetical protein
MSEQTPALRTTVQNLLLELDKRFDPAEPSAYDVQRHAYRLRFAFARVEELAQAAVMQSPFYTPDRFDAAVAILNLDVDRARKFLRSTTSAATAPVFEPDRVAEQREAEKRAA